MGFKVLVAPDKFKGTLSARAAAEAMARGWQQARPSDEVELMPVSDGGDGFGELVGACRGAVSRRCRTVDAAHRPCDAEWWWDPRTQTAVIEAARVNGLAQLPPGKYHPFELDTFGLGAVFQAAASQGARRCLVGIGGSATNDGGFGLAKALGWIFLNERGLAIERWTELHALSQIRFAPSSPEFEEVLVAVDVQNPLLGSTGCTRIYGPQKGLRPEDWPSAERCLGRLAEVVQREIPLEPANEPGSRGRESAPSSAEKDQRGLTSAATGCMSAACAPGIVEAANEPGAGAAGGLGFGLRVFLRARLEHGFGLFARYTRLEQSVRDARLVLTGEGAIDASTLMGKGVGELAELCRRIKVPCLALAGVVTDPVEAGTRFDKALAMVPDLTTREQALAEPALWLERLAWRAAREWRPAIH
jgi:glycerate 2-kinase